MAKAQLSKKMPFDNFDLGNVMGLDQKQTSWFLILDLFIET